MCNLSNLLKFFKKTPPLITVLYTDIKFVSALKDPSVKYFRIGEKNIYSLKLRKLLKCSRIVIIIIDQEKDLFLETGIKALRQEAITLGITDNANSEFITHHKNCFDSVMIIDNQTTLETALAKTIETLKAISKVKGDVNIEFQSIRNLLKNSGNFTLEIIKTSGEDRVNVAGKQLKQYFKKNTNGNINDCLSNITAGQDLTLLEFNDVMEHVRSLSFERRGIFGANIDEIEKDLCIATIATFG